MNTSRQSRSSFTNRASRRGNIAILAAVFLVVAIAFLALSADLGYMVVSESELQNAADAGAMSAARALGDGRVTAIAAAKTWAGKNLAASQPVALVDSDVEFGRWEAATFTVIPENSPETPNAVRVTCHRTTARGNSLNLFFGRVLGSRQANLTVSAIARVKPQRCGLIIGLNKLSMKGSSRTDSYRSEDGPYNRGASGTNGHVCSNADINMSGSTTIRGNARPGPDRIVKRSGSSSVLGKKEPLEEALDLSATDPGDASSNNNNLAIPLSDKGEQPLNKGEFTLSGNDGVDLPPGTYYFSKLSLTGGSSIRLSGPTVIYVTGDCSFSGSSVVNHTQLPKNLQLYPMGKKCVISGSSQFYGMIYGPNTKVERTGSSDVFGSVVAGELVLSGSGGIHADESLESDGLDGGSKRVLLVQ